MIEDYQRNETRERGELEEVARKYIQSNEFLDSMEELQTNVYSFQQWLDRQDEEKLDWDEINKKIKAIFGTSAVIFKVFH